MVKIAPSLLASDFSRLGDEILRAEGCGADMIHIDVMDGCFVPNITVGPPVVKSLRGRTPLPFDVHLMVREPLRFVGAFAGAGADVMIFHLEAAGDPDETIEKIRGLGKKAGMSVKPGTPVEKIYPYLKKIDSALVMTVEPGFGGQDFMPEALPRIAALRKRCLDEGIDLDIEVDGGINAGTAAECAKNGANVFVAGHALFSASDLCLAVKELRQSAARGLCNMLAQGV